ncbi:MAG: ABC transporter permease [Clostridiales bacterium]|nr:ABC transporter permease [Clostridiales bacterium]
MGQIKKSVEGTISRLKGNGFLFEQLVKRDFAQKYKRTILGMAWSVLSPLLQLLVMKLVFQYFFGRTINHFPIYLLAGNIVMSYYREATTGGMTSLLSNAGIITKINVPKYLFLLSKNVSALMNFGLSIIVFFVFCIIDSIQFGWHFFLLLYPIVCILLLNIGVGMILSALYVFFRDMTYLYNVFLMLLTYMSAIFYPVDSLPADIQRLFLFNPVYVFIKYFRTIVIDGLIPSGSYHLLCAFYAVIFIIIGSIIYKLNNNKFVYYL